MVGGGTPAPPPLTLSHTSTHSSQSNETSVEVYEGDPEDDEEYEEEEQVSGCRGCCVSSCAAATCNLYGCESVALAPITLVSKSTPYSPRMSLLLRNSHDECRGVPDPRLKLH